MGDESGSLNLAVQFIAVVEGFSASLDKVTAKLESLVTRIDKMSGKSSKASDAMSKDQDKVAASVEKTSKKMTEAATAANNYGRTIETSRVALKGLDAATIANLNSSNMSKEMFSTLSSKMKVFSGASWESRQALVSMAKSADNNVMAFKQMSGALETNEKHLWNSLAGTKQVRAELGANALPRDMENVVKSVDRLKFAQATLNGEMYKSSGVLFDGRKNFVDFQKEVAGLSAKFGENAMLATNMTNRLGSYVKTIPAAVTELTAYNKVAAQDLSLANAIVSQRTKLETKNYDLATSTGKMNQEYTRLVSTLTGDANVYTRVSGAVSRLNTEFLKGEKGAALFNAETAKLGFQSSKTATYVNDLRRASERGIITWGESTKLVRAHGQELLKVGQSANVTSGFWANLSGKLVGGGAAAKGASDYFSRLGQAVGSLSAWMVAATIIGGVTAALGSAVKAVVDYDQALKSLQAISGGTEAEISLLGKEILNISNTTKYSAAEIAKGAIFIAQAGFTAGESLVVIGAAARGAQGTLESLTISADLLTTVLRSFHIDASKASIVMDMLSVAANKSKTDLEGMRIVFNYLGPAAFAAGVKLEETLGTIMALSNSGMRMSTVGTSLRQVFINLENPNAKLKKALIESGMTVDSLSTKVQGGLVPVLQNLNKVIGGDLTKAVQFFNVRTAPAALVISQMSEHVALMIKFTKEYGVSAAMAGTQSEGMAVKISMLSNQFQNFIIRMSEGGLTKAFKLVIDSLGLLIKGIEYLVNNPFVNFIATTGVMFGAIVLLKNVLLSLASVIKSVLIGASVDALLTAAKTMGSALALQHVFSLLVNVIFSLGNAFKFWIVYLASGFTSTIALTKATTSLSIAWAVLNTVFTASTIGFVLAGLALLAAIIYKVTTSTEKHSLALQEQTILYANNQQKAADFAAQLRALNTTEEKSVEDSQTYAALLKQIRETFPQVTAELVKNKNNLEAQAVALDKVSTEFKIMNETMAKAAISDIVRQFKVAGYESEMFSQAIKENRTQLYQWILGVAGVTSILPAFLGSLFKMESATKLNTWAWVQMKLAWNTTSAQAIVEAAAKSEAALNKQRDLYPQVASIIINSSKDIRKALLAMIPEGEMKKMAEGTVAMHDKFVESMKVGASKISQKEMDAVAEMGAAWVDYYAQQDERGRAEVASMATNAKKKIDTAMKAFEKENSDATLRLNERIRLEQDAYDTMMKNRAKHVDDILKLMDKLYTEEDKKIKLSTEKSLEYQDVLKNKELLSLRERFDNEADFTRRKAELEEKDIETRRAIVDKGMKAELAAATKSYEAKKALLEAQTRIVGTDLEEKQLEIKKNLVDKEIEIYKGALTYYKTMIGERVSLINKYRDEHLAALKAIEKAEADLQKTLEDINLKKRETMRLTMTEEQVLADKKTYLSETLAKGYTALGEAEKAGSKEVKDVKLAAAKEYFDKYTGMISDITAKTKDAEGKSMDDTRATQSERLALYNNAENAYKDMTKIRTDMEKATADSTKKGIEENKASFASLEAEYTKIKKLFEEKIAVSIESDVALNKLKELAKFINETAVEVVVKFYGEASPKDTLNNTIESVKKMLTGFSTDLKAFDLGFVITLKATLSGTKENAKPIADVIAESLAMLNLLKAEVEKITPALTIGFYGNLGTEVKPLLSFAFLQAKTYADAFATQIRAMVNQFFVYFVGVDGGSSPLSAMISSVENKMRQLSNSINAMKTVFTIVTRHVTEGSSSSSSSRSSSSTPTTGDGSDYGGAPPARDDFADGGSIPGSGDGDTVPIMATPGEFVMRKSAVNVFGEGFFHMINNMKSFSMPKFNMGGMVQAFAQGGGVKRVNEYEVFTLNLQAGSAKMPLQVMGNPRNMRQTVRLFEKELSKMRLSNA